MTQPNHSTVSSAVFTRAWTEFCRTSEGRYEYWRRFGDYLFTDPAREIPRELLVAPPTTLRPRRQRAFHVSVPSERGTTQQAAAILGLGIRKVQTMAQRGAIPGAAKIERQWTFDLAKLRRFVEQQEQAICQNEKPHPVAIGAGKFSGAKLRLGGSASGGRLRQMIQQSQRRVAKQAKNAH